MEQIQLKHDEVTQARCIFPIYVVCDNIRSPENAGMIFRISEAFGVQKIHFSNASPKSDNTRLKRAARSTQSFIEHEYSSDIKNVVIQLKKDGFSLIGIEITNTSKSLRNISFVSYEKIALVIGAEKNGISSEILEILDSCIHIPMYGKNSSMNVVNALAITLYEISSQIQNRV